MNDDGLNAADAAAIEQTAAVVAGLDANRRAITAKAGNALTDLGTLIASTDAAINANPAVPIRTIARAVRLLIRLELDQYEGTS